jgi:hypothetical protein
MWVPTAARQLREAAGGQQSQKQQTELTRDPMLPTPDNRTDAAMMRPIADGGMPWLAGARGDLLPSPQYFTRLGHSLLLLARGSKRRPAANPTVRQLAGT